MSFPKIIPIVFFVFLTSYGITAQDVSPEITVEIQKQIENLRKAHLNSDKALADKLYHPNLILTAQSGKKYKKELALKNIENTFENYESSDFDFLQVAPDVVLTNYINERKYKDFKKGKFRLTVVWTKHEGDWQIISMQSSKIKERK